MTDVDIDIDREDCASTVVDGRESAGHGIAALRCVGVTKIFPVFDAHDSWRIVLGLQHPTRTVEALTDVSLVVPKGEIVGVLGRNGAGKSTLLRVLAGVYSLSRGEIWRTGSMAGLFEIGVIANRLMTGREYARRALMLQGVKRKALPAVVEDVRDFSELAEAFEAPIYTYSTGMAARLYFAAATSVQHDIYLVDEILAVGDEHFRNKCWARMRERLSTGASGVLVTHDWSAALRLCRVSYVLDDGRIVDSGPTDRVVQSYLQLAKPESRAVRFTADVPSRFTGRSRHDAELAFAIDVDEPVPVCLAYSVEMLRLGVGWEIVLLDDSVPVDVVRGRNEVRLTIPALPLPGGRYYLNVFLTSPRDAVTPVAAQVYDARSWTHGNPFELVVEGPHRDSSALLPAHWERRDVGH